MKRTNYILLALTLLLTFVGCNQKEKKLAKIVDGITTEQSEAIKATLNFSDNLDLKIAQQADTVVFAVVEIASSKDNDEDYEVAEDESNEDSIDDESQKKKIMSSVKTYLLSAFCSDPIVKDLLQQIADISAHIKFTFGNDEKEANPDIVIIGNAELQKVLAEKYTSHDVLISYIDVLNAISSDKETKIFIEGNYVTIEYRIDSVFADIEDRVEYDIYMAKNSFLSNIDDIVDFEQYKGEISESYVKEYQDKIKESLLEEDDFFNWFKPLLKDNAGLIVRYSDNNSDKSIDVVFEPDELKQLIK